MAYTLNGFGTTYLGIGEPEEEGWRTATLWFVIAGLPLIPLKYRLIRPTLQKTEFGDTTTEMEIADSGFPRIGQVLKTYLLYWCFHLPLAVGPPIGTLIWTLNAEKGTFGDEYGIYILIGTVLWVGIYAGIVGSTGDDRMEPVVVEEWEEEE